MENLSDAQYAFYCLLTGITIGLLTLWAYESFKKFMRTRKPKFGLKSKNKI